MAVSYSAANRTITFNSTGVPDDMDEVVAAVSDTAVCDLLIPEARVFFIDDCQLYFSTSASHFQDSEFALYHNKDASWTTDRAFWWDDSTPGTVTWGEIDNTDIFAPIVWGDAHYFFDCLIDPDFTMWGYHTFGAMSGGSLRMYGGIFEDLPRGVDPTYGQFLYFPTTETTFIGVIFERWGGHRYWGTNYIGRELIFKGGDNAAAGSTSGPYGFSLGGTTAVDDALFDITIEENATGYYFYDVNGGTLRGARLRNNYEDLTFIYVVSGLLVHLIDCDPYQTVGGDNTDGVVEEYTSYNLTCLEADGATPIEDVRVRVWRTNPSTAYVTAGSASGELTASDGHPTSSDELLLLTTSIDSASIGDRVTYGPYYLKARGYGRTLVLETGAQQITPDPPSPIVHDLIMPCTGLMDDNCDDSNVSAYTGIAVNTGTSAITLTEVHTVKSIFSYVHYYFTLAAQMDDDTLPIVTYDGKLYVIATGWSISGEDTLMTLGLSLLELANGDRWVPIYLAGMQEYAHYLIETTGEVELFSGEVDTTEEFLSKYEWLSSNVAVNVFCRLQGYDSYNKPGTITNNGLIVAVNLLADPEYRVLAGRLDQLHFRWRDDDGSETGATWLQNEDVNHTGLAKETNIRLRIQLDEYLAKPNNVMPTLQVREVGATAWEVVE